MNTASLHRHLLKVRWVVTTHGVCGASNGEPVCLMVNTKMSQLENHMLMGHIVKLHNATLKGGVK